MLIPGGGAQLGLAKRVATALRLFATETGDSRSPSASVHAASLRDVYERRRQERMFAVLEDLVRHVLLARATAETFVVLEEPKRSYTRDWESYLRLAAKEPSGDEDLAVPVPGTSESKVLEGLLGGLDLLAARAPGADRSIVCEVWRAQIDWLDVLDRGLEQAGAADLVFDSLARAEDAAKAAKSSARLRRSIAAVRLAVALDRGDPHGVATLLEERGDGPRVPAEVEDACGLLELIARWTIRFEGSKPIDLEGAAERAALRIPSAWRRTVAAFQGRDLGSDSFAERGAGLSVRDREDLAFGEATPFGHGMTVSALAGGGVLKSIDPDGAEPGRAEPDCVGREEALSPMHRASPEYEALRRGLTLIRSGEGCSTTIVEPLRDELGRHIGCVRLDQCHRILPSAARLARAARAAAVLIDEVHSHVLDPVPSLAGIAFKAGHPSWQPVWDVLVERLGWKAGRRRWFVLQGHRPEGETVAAGGEADLGPFHSSADHVALQRAAALSGVVSYANNAHCSTHFGDAVVGVCVPVAWGGAILAWLVVESSRAVDVTDALGLRWQSIIEDHGATLVCKRLSVRGGDGGGLAMDAEDPDAPARLAMWRRAICEHRDVLLRGEPGSGRSTLARALHRLRLESCGRACVVACFGLRAEDLARRLGARAGDTLILIGLEALERSAQVVLATWLARTSRGTCIATTTAGATLEHPEIAAAFDRCVLRTEPLSERRHEIPAIVRHLLGEVGAKACVPGAGEPLAIEDEALALLWRQTWPRGAHDLRRVLFAAAGRFQVRTGDEERVLGRAAFEAVFAIECGPEVRVRLPSKDPNPRDLAAAAWCTRTASGRINKSRAALYLGWDPATVKARLEDAGLVGLEDVAELLRRPPVASSSGPPAR